MVRVPPFGTVVSPSRPEAFAPRGAAERARFSLRCRRVQVLALAVTRGMSYATGNAGFDGESTVNIISRVSAVLSRHGMAVGLLVVLLSVASAGSAHANFISTLSFSGAEWSNGSGLSGSITYEYDASNDLIAILEADISVLAGTNIPAVNLSYDVPAQPNTASTPGWDYNNPSNENYEITISDSATGNINLYLDMSGIGPTAMLATAVSGGNYSSIADYNVSGSVYGLSSAGTSMDQEVPEPSSMCILLAGLLGILLARHACVASV